MAIHPKLVNWCKYLMMHIKLFTLACIVLSYNALGEERCNFVTQPSNVSVMEGKQASFLCTLKCNQTFMSAAAFWNNGVTKTSAGGELVTTQTWTDRNSRSVTSELTTDKVDRGMNNFLFACSVFIHFDEENLETVSSHYGKLNVLFCRNVSFSECQGPSSLIQHEGNVITLECRLQGICNPSVVMEWISASSGQSHPVSGSLGNETTLVTQLTIQRWHHDHTFYCVAKSEGLLQPNINCSVGPIKVLHSPSVRTFPSLAIVIVPLFHELVFFCETKAYPAVHRITWSFSEPMNLFSRCESKSQELRISVDSHMSNITDLQISCTAENDLGQSRNTSSLTITKVEEPILPCLSNGSGSLAKENDPRIIIMQRNDFFTTMTCFAAIDSPAKESIRWYLNGYLVEGNKQLSRFNGVKTNDSFTLDSIKIVSEHGFMTCQILVSRTKSLYSTCKLNGHLESTSESNPTYSDTTELLKGENPTTGTSIIVITVVTGSGFLLFSAITCFLMQRCNRRVINNGTTECRHRSTVDSVLESPTDSEAQSISFYELSDSIPMQVSRHVALPSSLGYIRNLFRGVTSSNSSHDDCSNGEGSHGNDALYASTEDIRELHLNQDSDSVNSD